MLVGEDATGGHGAGAIVLHVTTGLLLAATVLHGRRTRVWWPAALAAAVFVLTFVQAALGSSGSITTHVPLALVVTVGVVWLGARSFRPPPAPPPPPPRRPRARGSTRLNSSTTT